MYDQFMARWTVVVVVVLWFASAYAERLRAPDGEIREVPSASVEYAIKDGYERLPQVWMRAPDGKATTIDEDLVPSLARQGYWKMTPSEVESQEWLRQTETKIAEEVRQEEARSRYLRGPTGDVVVANGTHAGSLIAGGYVEISRGRPSLRSQYQSSRSEGTETGAWR
jgi:hypothetical protein